MSKIDNGGPVHPTDPEVLSDYDGMTLRQWYAGMAMQGMIASDSGSDYENKEAWAYKDNLPGTARRAFEVADAMLAHERGEEA